MSDEQNTAAAPAGRTATWIIAVAFAILYAGPLFWAVSDLVEYPAQVGGRTPWWLLIVAVAIPVALYVGGLLLGRARTPVLRTILLGAGLCAANALTIAGIALAPFLL
ncbi:hypothetical protein GCM10009840_15210 [Pseudolysinimonas kribbensis]|uniref:hypothetical protein n=1 Tax=Pseudolysinimonas kribbensis TaxID=433641 RepID=UPI0031D071C9